MRIDIWTEERVKRATELWKKGWSSSQIGDDIGVSRCAVAGFANRNRDIMPARAQTGRAVSGSPKRERSVQVVALVVIHDEPPMVKPKEYDLSRMPYAKFLHETTDRECKWALTDDGPHLFCAETTLRGKSWCAHHAVRLIGSGTRSEQAAVRDAQRAA